MSLVGWWPIGNVQIKGQVSRVLTCVFLRAITAYGVGKFRPTVWPLANLPRSWVVCRQAEGSVSSRCFRSLSQKAFPSLPSIHSNDP